MFKRFNRAKMLALVASLGAFGANVNSNAGAVNKAVPVAAGAAGGLLTGIIGMAAFVKYSNFGKKLAFSNELKYLAEVIKEAKVDTLYIKIDKSANVKVKLDKGDRKKVDGILEKRIGKALGYDKKEQLEGLTKEEAEKLLSKITPLFADMVSKLFPGRMQDGQKYGGPDRRTAGRNRERLRKALSDDELQGYHAQGDRQLRFFFPPYDL